MSSINNTQRCLLKAAGVTYERLLPICLTLFSCSSCHAVRMSAATADGSLSCPPLQTAPLPPLSTVPSFQGGWEMAQACEVTQVPRSLWHLDPWRQPPWPECHTFSCSDGEPKTNLIIYLPLKKRMKSSLSVRCFDNHLSTRPVISWTGPVWHSQWRGDGTRVVHLSSHLPLSPLLSISLVPLPCVHNLISKQGVDSHYGNPGKWPGHFPPVSGISIWKRHPRSHCPPCPISVCVLVSLCCKDGFHSPLATIRLAHQVDSIRIDNPFQ